jgi:hypothetical protein
MKFDGLMPFRIRVPNSSIEREAEQFDLHNDAELREFNIDFRQHIVRLSWTLKRPAWTLPGGPEHSRRKTIAGFTLIFSGVRRILLSGVWLESANDANELDFFEYSEPSADSGETRFVMGNDAEVTILADRCELRSLGEP